MGADIVPIRATEVLEVRGNWVVEKEKEIERGREAIEALKRIGATKSKIARAKGRIHFAERFIALLKEGFIPIPRMEFEDFMYHGKMYLSKMPIEGLLAIDAVKGKFDTIGLVRPMVKKRDPIIIGVIRYDKYEEHFIIGWWRPELYRDVDLW